MKNYFLSISAIVLTAGALVFTGCKKDDATAPEVTVNGGDKTISLGSTYADAGATAKDDKDGDISSSITVTGSVNTGLKGTYTLTYTATDAAGNVGEATRKVTVINDADIYAGTYVTKDKLFGKDSIWIQKVSASNTTNNTIVFEKFANRDKNSNIEAFIKGTSFELRPATVILDCTYTYAPNTVGAVITKVGTKYAFSIKYTEARGGTGAGCSVITPTAFEDFFVQQ